MGEDRAITTRADADSIADDIAEVYDGWYANEPRIDWDDFLDRLEGRGFDLGDSLTSPAIRRIKEIVRSFREQA